MYWWLVGLLWLIALVVYWLVTGKAERESLEQLFVPLPKNASMHYVDVLEGDKYILITCSCGWGVSCEGSQEEALELIATHPDGTEQ